MPSRSTTIAAILLAAPGFSASCSTVPAREWPAFELRAVRATFAARPGAPIELPVSDDRLTILSLQLEPPPAAEVWRDGRRSVLPAAGSDRLVVTCRYRAYLDGTGGPSPQQLFPGAAITELEP
ncbi:MAG: hypothetical protein AB7O97_21895 [Planctomycetota bacterium]